MIVLAIDSRASTWDLIRGAVGPDARFLDLALQHTFDRLRVDPARLTLAGFSDGATYAISLGPTNGDLFSHIVAYSPGKRVALGPLTGRPRIFVSHGTDDPVIPVSITRDTTVPSLRAAGYDVTFVEFAGGHTVPSPIIESSLNWFLGEAGESGKSRARPGATSGSSLPFITSQRVRAGRISSVMVVRRSGPCNRAGRR